MITLTKLSETALTITLGWTPVPGATGYRFTAENQAKPSHSWDANRSSVRFQKGSAWYRVEALGIEDSGEYPSPLGANITRFTDLYYKWGASAQCPNGQTFMNRWNAPNLQTCATSPTPWPRINGPAIQEVIQSGRPGFRFRCNPEMADDPTVKRVELQDWIGNPNAVAPSPIAKLGSTRTVDFYITFPAGGNPQGFPGNTDRWNVLWQHVQDPDILSLAIGIATSGGTPRFYASVRRHPPSSTEAFGKTLTWPIELDRDYHFRYEMNFRDDANGYFRWWIDGTQYADYAGPTCKIAPGYEINTEFGFYGPREKDNEVIFSGITVA